MVANKKAVEFQIVFFGACVPIMGISRYPLNCTYPKCIFLLFILSDVRKEYKFLNKIIRTVLKAQVSFVSELRTMKFRKQTLRIGSSF